MGKITSSVGLVSGIPIQDTVDKLMALQSAGRDKAVADGKVLTDQKTAVLKLETLLVGLQFTSNRLTGSTLFQQRTVSSSNDSVLSATINGQPSLGNYQFTPVRTAANQQFQSSKFVSATSAIGAGTLTLRSGGFADASASLDLLQSGAGLTRGKIRITDRSGASSEIDLSYARTVDDVLQAINSNSTINVTAQAQGDRIKLVDNTGQSVSNLKVQEVGSGTTAASLGLSGIDVAATSATGQDVLKLFNDITLNSLNNGLGVRFDSSLSDLRVTFRDGTQTDIDLHKLGNTGVKASGTTNALFGTNAKVAFTAAQAGAAGEGVRVQFVNDDSVTAGNETVSYNAQAKIVTFKIDEGHTTANQVIQALGKDSTASAVLTAARPTGGNGTALIDTSDSAVTVGPSSTAITPGDASPDGAILFTAADPGGAFDNVEIRFVDNATVTRGNEQAVYDDSDPDHKTLTFQIDAGHTTANDVIAALNNNSVAREAFTATTAPNSNGQGLVSTDDTVTTSGGSLTESSSATNELTLGNVLDAINAVAPTKLRAQISADGDHVELVDLTAPGSGSFTITDLNNSHVAADLGLVTAASGDTISGNRILAGLKTSLLSKFGGGSGLGTLGQLNITDRSGASASVDLSSAQTLDDVLTAINTAGLGVKAAVNKARNGIDITDTTGATASNLIIANGDGTNTGTKLGLTVNAAVTTKTGGDLKPQAVGENTLLSSLNGGKGVTSGNLRIIDTEGHSATLTIGSNTTTIGDVIKGINRLGLGVTARINDAGDGIALIDTAHGGSTLTVTEGGGSTAKDLHLLNTATTVDISNTPTQVIDGSTSTKITLTADDTLQTLVDKLNDSGSGLRAAVLNDGSSVKPYQFTIFNQNSGKAGELAVDTSLVNFSVDQTIQAQDALLLVGGNSGGTLASSATGVFNEVLPDVTLTVKGTSTSPVTVSVGSTNTTLTSVMQSIVDGFNRIHSAVADLTKYDDTTQTRALFQGDGTLLSVDSQLSQLVSGRIFGAGSIQSLASLGISVSQDGSLKFDADKFNSKYASDPNAVQDFLGKSDTGLGARFNKLLDQLSGEGNSLLVNRSTALDKKISVMQTRIDFLNARLDSQRERLLLEFNRMEESIAKIQSNQSYLGTLQQLAGQSSGSG